MVSVVKMSANNTLKDVDSFFGRVTAASTHEAELRSSPSATLSVRARATAELRQARDTISTQNKKLAEVMHLKMSINSLKDSIAFYKAREESLKSELSAEMTESTRIGLIFDDTSADVVDL